MDDSEIIKSIVDSIIDFIVSNIPDEIQTVVDTIPIHCIEQTSTTQSNKSDSDSEGPPSNKLFEIGEDEDEICPWFDEITIQFAAEQADLYKNLTEEASAIIISKCKYYLSELIDNAAQFMRHSYRQKLTTKDTFRAMQETECDVIFGHNNPAISRINNYYDAVPSALAFVEKNFKINLKKETCRYLKLPEFQHDLQKQHRYGFDIEWFSETDSRCDTISLSTKSKVIDEYFQKFIETLTRKNPKLKDSEQERCLQIFLNDISTNPSLKPLLCPLLYFVRNTLKEWESASRRSATIDTIVFNQSRLKFTRKFLSVLGAIIQNHTFVDLSLNSKVLLDLSETILSLCFHEFEDLTLNSYAKLYDEILNIHSYASCLFAKILFKFPLPFSDAAVRIIKLLCSKIMARKTMDKDRLKASTVDFAMLSIFRHLGFDMCLRYLLPLFLDNQSFLNVYLENLANNTKIESKEDLITRQIDNLIAGQICMVGRLVLKGLDLLILEKPKDIVLIDSSNHIYSYFYHWFGDSLFCSLYPILESPKLNNWLDDRKFLFKMTQSGKPETEVDNNVRVNPEKSINKQPKKKATKLLESMLSTDTTKMAKNESLSMFTDSLLDSSHNQYERTFLYQQDLDVEASKSSSTTLSKNLIVFEGTRWIPKKKIQGGLFSKIIPPRINVSHIFSEWYHLSVNHRSMEPVPMPGFRRKVLFKKARIEQQVFQYHRQTPQRLVSCSLYNSL